MIQDDDMSGDEGGVEAETNMTLHGWVSMYFIAKGFYEKDWVWVVM